MREKFFALSRLSQIVLVVVALHFAALFSLFVHHFISKKPEHTKISVRTVFPQAPPPMAASTRPSVAVETKKVAPAPKKEKLKEAAKIQPAPKETPIKEKKGSLSLAAEIEKNLADLSSDKRATSFPSTPLKVPKNISQVVKREAVTPEEIDYGQTLALYLENILELPEYGEVTIDLEVDANGHLVHFEMKEMKSVKNGEYLKKRLPELCLPCFNGLGGSDAARKFTITFKNAK